MTWMLVTGLAKDGNVMNVLKGFVSGKFGGNTERSPVDEVLTFSFEVAQCYDIFDRGYSTRFLHI